MPSLSRDPVRARRAHALILAWHGDRLVGLHYPTRRTAPLEDVDLALLAAAGDWVDAESLNDSVPPEIGGDAYRQSLHKLFAAHHLLHEGTDVERLDAAVRDRWPWGHQSAVYHLSVRDPGFVTTDRAGEIVRWRLDNVPQVPLTRSNDDAAAVTPLPAPDLGDPLFAVLAARRSHRTFAARPLALADLSRVLAAGLGITGWAVTGLDDEGMARLPLKMAPSGGARNPFEGYVVARRVDGLEPGVHHYSGCEHTLGRVGEAAEPPAFSSLLGGQGWFDDAAAVVFLVADIERTAWKYTHPNAYRVVLMEAGHVGQNLLLAAADAGLAAAPTAAIDDGAVERLLGIEPPLQAALYAVLLGPRGEGRSWADFRCVVPNPVFG